MLCFLYETPPAYHTLFPQVNGTRILRVCGRHKAPLPPGGCRYPPRPGWGPGAGWCPVSALPWNATDGASRPRRETPRPPTPSCAPARPRGLPYLDRVLQQPHADRKLSAFVRFREYVERRAGRHSRTSITDRARLRELEQINEHTVIERRSNLELTAATWLTILRLSTATNTSTKTILEALVSLGLEQTAYAIREQGSAPAVVS